MASISTGVLSKLREFDTPTVCNLIELFEVRPRNEGYMDARIRACFPGDEAHRRLRVNGDLPLRQTSPRRRCLQRLKPAGGGV